MLNLKEFMVSPPWVSFLTQLTFCQLPHTHGYSLVNETILFPPVLNAECFFLMCLFEHQKSSVAELWLSFYLEALGKPATQKINNIAHVLDIHTILPP